MNEILVTAMEFDKMVRATAALTEYHQENDGMVSIYYMDRFDNDIGVIRETREGDIAHIVLDDSVLED